MIAYIEGKLSFKSPSYVHIDTGGVAYHIEISMHTFSQLEGMEKARLYTHLYIREDGHFLYGFYEEKERDLFRLLISVSGIGPGTAQVILSTLKPDEIIGAIATGQDVHFRNVKGIGAKTAQRIILDLKDKIVRISAGGEAEVPMTGAHTLRKEVLSALRSLGIHRSKAEPLLNRILKENPELDQLEDVLKMVLKQLN